MVATDDAKDATTEQKAGFVDFKGVKRFGERQQAGQQKKLITRSVQAAEQESAAAAPRSPEHSSSRSSWRQNCLNRGVHPIRVCLQCAIETERRRSNLGR